MRQQTHPFPADRRSVAAARRFVRVTLTGPGHAPEAVEDAVLIVSELASNVVEHARTEYEIGIAVDGDRARIEVADGSAILPAVRDAAHDSERGRGLHLLETLARDWGIDQRSSGKAIWFELDLSGGDP
jgi:anti-sigma regulatory factor (Ser/Thr protein kinase)